MARKQRRHAWHHVAVALAALVDCAAGACFNHKTCKTCITENFNQGSCMWYIPPKAVGRGSCIAGHTGYVPPVKGSIGTDTYSKWSSSAGNGATISHTLFDLDRSSQGSCYKTECLTGTLVSGKFRVGIFQCDIGYFPVRNTPCYSDTLHPEIRILECCRQQRNIDGYLRGFEAQRDLVQGGIFYADCCTVCFPGEVNVGCSIFSTGECVKCPAGRFNPSGDLGSVCHPCKACPPGTWSTCKGSSAGRCEQCPVGKFKAAGLEGGAGDTCQDCRDCPAGLRRVGCGLEKPGTCEACPAGRWFTGTCRQCATCPDGGTRMGCGGTLEGICTACPLGRFAEEATCRLCRECPGTLALGTTAMGGVPSPIKRVGCGGAAFGECVQLEASLEGDQRACLETPWNGTGCPRTAPKVRWVLHGIAAAQLASSSANCTAATGLCLVGRWSVELWRRRPSVPHGSRIQNMGAWWSEELEATGMQNATFAAEPQLLPLPSNLPDGTGYFLRVNFTDLSSSCCGKSEAQSLVADTNNFAVISSTGDATADLQAATLEAVEGNEKLAIVQLTALCNGRAGIPTQGIGFAACERMKSLGLGLAIGEVEVRPQRWQHKAGTVFQQAVYDAMGPVLQAQQMLLRLAAIRASVSGATNWSSWFGRATTTNLPPTSTNLTQTTTNLPPTTTNLRPNYHQLTTSLPPTTANLPQITTNLPPTTTNNGSVRRRLVPLEWNCSASHDISDVECPMQPLLEFSHNLNTIVRDLKAMCYDEFRNATAPLHHALRDLKEADTVLSDSAASVGFDVVRMAQAVMRQLWATRAQPPAKNSAAEFLAAFKMIGSTALLLLGTWGSTWRHDLQWQIEAVVGSGELMGQQEVLAFGGAPELTDGVVPISESRKRVWEPFLSAAQAWLGDWNATAHHSDMHLTTLADLVSDALDLVATMTENVLNQLAQPGSELLSGTLPNISGCCRRTRTLSSYLSAFNESIAGVHAKLGFGRQVIRPWLSLQSEKMRVERLANDIVRLAWARYRALEALLLQTLDARDAKVEHVLIHQASLQTDGAAQHLAAFVSMLSWDPMPSRQSSEWLLRDATRSLVGALASCDAAAGYLSAGRLRRLQQLTAWTANAIHNSSATSAGWRKAWPVADASPSLFKEAVRAAGMELERNLRQAAQKSASRGAGFFRFEAESNSNPLIFAGLANSGSAIFWLEPSFNFAKFAPLLMHEDARAFLVSPASVAKPLLPNGSSVASTSHIELQLRRLLSTASEPPELGSINFSTWHARHSCKQLRPTTSPPSTSGPTALIPLTGLWLVQARDSSSQRLLTIDSGTKLRLLFKVDVPVGDPPWQLYRTPEGDDCNSLLPMFGSLTPPPTPAPSHHTSDVPSAFLPSATTTTAPKIDRSSPPKSSTAATQSLPRTTSAAALPAAPSENTAAILVEKLQSPMYLALLFGACLGTCCCCTVCLVWCFRRWHDRRLRSLVTDADPEPVMAPEAKKEEPIGTGTSCGPPDTSVGQDLKKQDLHALTAALNEGPPLPSLMRRPGLRASATTRPDDRGELREASDVGSDNDSKAWHAGATPSAGSPRSTSSDSITWSEPPAG